MSPQPLPTCSPDSKCAKVNEQESFVSNHEPGSASAQLDNIMLHGEWPRPILKICDFGYSKDEVGQSVSKSTCGTPEYMAPEVLFEEKVRTASGCAVTLMTARIKHLCTAALPQVQHARSAHASIASLSLCKSQSYDRALPLRTHMGCTAGCAALLSSPAV